MDEDEKEGKEGGGLSSREAEGRRKGSKKVD